VREGERPIFYSFSPGRNICWAVVSGTRGEQTSRRADLLLQSSAGQVAIQPFSEL
jgi:hypothetical protein